MNLPATEHLHPAAPGLEALPVATILAHLLDGQQQALASVAQSLGAIAAGAALMTAAVRGGGRLGYAGAGSSALMAMADGMELHGTFGIDPDRVILLMAGGLPIDARMPGATEDDAQAGSDAGQLLRAGDALIVVTASGRTPYALAVAASAREKGVSVIAIANAPDAPLFALSDVPICLNTPPELIAGSTRMGAGTAQKATLNLLSTLMGIGLGQVHDGMMVGLTADNAKLRGRAEAMVAAIAGVDARSAGQALAAAGGAVKPAVLIARGHAPLAAAALLAATEGHLRAALQQSAAAQTAVAQSAVAQTAGPQTAGPQTAGPNTAAPNTAAAQTAAAQTAAAQTAAAQTAAAQTAGPQTAAARASAQVAARTAESGGDSRTILTNQHGSLL